MLTLTSLSIEQRHGYHSLTNLLSNSVSLSLSKVLSSFPIRKRKAPSKTLNGKLLA